MLNMVECTITKVGDVQGNPFMLICGAHAYQVQVPTQDTSAISHSSEE